MRRTKMWAYINLFGEREVVELSDFYPSKETWMRGLWIIVAEDGMKYIAAPENFVIRRVEVDEGGDER